MNQDDSWAPIREYSAGNRRRRFPWEAGVGLVVVIGLLAWFLVPQYLASKRASEEKNILGNVYRCLVAAEQFFKENPGRLFVRHDEIVGPGQVVEPLAAVAGEDYATLFPLRRDHRQLAVTTRDGRRVICFMYPAPTGLPERGLLAQRADGVLVGPEVVLKAYRRIQDEARRDGVHEQRFPDGSRFETTYQGGVPHGPFKAHYPDGRLWGEANYEQGRIVGPCWNHPREGAHFDEASLPEFSRAMKSVP